MHAGIQKQLEKKKCYQCCPIDIQQYAKTQYISLTFLADVAWSWNNRYRAMHICCHCVYKPFNPWLKRKKELIWHKRDSWLKQLLDGFSHSKNFKSFQNHRNQIYSVLKTLMACFLPSFISPVFLQCLSNQRE